MSCVRCKVDPEARKQWGCDGPVDHVVTTIRPCPFCRGGLPTCSACQGDDAIPIRRCPNALVTMRELEAVHAASQVEFGILPDQGGMQDQSATFVAALPLLQFELAHWARENERLAAEAAQRKHNKR